MEGMPQINDEKCTLCGKCVKVCPKKVLFISDKKLHYTDQECMLCAHCFGVCPENAISFYPNDLKIPQIQSFTYKEKYIDSSHIDSSEFLNTLRSRRSIRKYKKDSLPEEVIEDLIQCAVTAPSGSNCQDWEFTVMNDHEKVWNLALKIKDSVKKFNAFVKNPFFRYASTLFLGNTLLKYHEHLESIEWAIEEAEKGNDLLFHSAPTLIIFHSHMEGSTPLEDAQYASYNCALMAHALGLGTCYIGYAVEILNRMKDIKKFCQIPQNHRVHSVLIAGYPDVTFSHLTLRKNYKINFI